MRDDIAYWIASTIAVEELLIRRSNRKDKKYSSTKCWYMEAD
jgi:hypothetical protein